ncbi:MAG TPA: hypothetical protein VF820_03220 [Patescibacteria group bacterium]
MKQHITIEQLNELSEKGKERLQYWYAASKYPKTVKVKLPEGFTITTYKEELWKRKKLPLLSIGQMIEFLEEKHELRRSHWENTKFIKPSSTTQISWTHESSINSHDICDNLWESAKEELEK